MPVRARPVDVAALTLEYGASARLTFSNSRLRREHLYLDSAPDLF